MDVDGPERTQGWQIPIGLQSSGRYWCEILTADYDGDHQPDGDLQGWYLQETEECQHGTISVTSDEIHNHLSRFRLECDCSAEGACPGCDTYDFLSCQVGNVYRYDGCGQLEELVEDCSIDEVCSEDVEYWRGAACVPRY